MSSGSGQLRPAARKRLSVARTVEGATPTRRAISWFDKSPTNFNRRTSRTWRIVVLSAGIRYLLWTAKGADLSRPAEAPTTRAKSSRNGGRNYLGMAGDIIPESWATSPGIGILDWRVDSARRLAVAHRHCHALCNDRWAASDNGQIFDRLQSRDIDRSCRKSDRCKHADEIREALSTPS